MRGLTKYCFSALLIAGLLLTQITSYRVADAVGLTGTSLTTSPVSIDISTKPGRSSSTQLEVMNNSSKPETVNVHLAEFKAYGTSGQPLIYKPAANDPSIGWVHFSTTSFTAQPGVWTNVEMTINLPSSASLGYYYAVLFTPQVANQAQTNTVKGSNAVLVLVNTNSGNEVRKLSITSFTSAKSVYQYLPTTFNVLVNNSGNIHLIPDGDIFISRSPNGKPIDTLDLNPGQGNVLPKSSREFQAQWLNGIPLMANETKNGKIVTNSHGKPIQQLQWNSSKPLSSIRFGKYYAHLVLEYNNGVTDIPVNGVLSFWVIPWELLIGVIIFFVIVIFLIAAAIWRMNRKVVTKVKSRRTDQSQE